MIFIGRNRAERVRLRVDEEALVGRSYELEHQLDCEWSEDRPMAPGP